MSSAAVAATSLDVASVAHARAARDASPRARAPGRRRRPPRLLAAALAAVVSLTLPASASAHGLGGSPTLPVPEWLFAWAAALVLVASFVGLSVLWPRPRMVALAHGRTLSVGDPARAVGRAVRIAGRVALGLLGSALYALTVWAGLAGTSDPLINIAPTMVFVVLWVGVPILAALVGDVWRVLSPWQAALDLARWTCARAGRSLPDAPRRYPARLGRWPAAALLLGFGWLELVAPGRDDPVLLAILALAYGAVMVAGLAVFGETFLRQADGFGNFSRIAATVSPLRWSTDEGLRLRPPGTGVAELRADPGLTAVLLALLGTTTFDGFSATGLWGASGGGASGSAGKALSSVGVGGGAANTITGTIGLVAAVALVTGLAYTGSRGTSGLTRGGATPREVLVRFAPTFAPIVVGYAIAHYCAFLLGQGQAMGFMLSDPLGTGANWLGTADWTVHRGFPSADVAWAIQIVALVAGHVIALTAAHDLALRTFRSPRTAVRSQQWMLAVMVGFTCLGLWLVTA